VAMRKSSYSGRLKPWPATGRTLSDDGRQNSSRDRWTGSVAAYPRLEAHGRIRCRRASIRAPPGIAPRDAENRNAGTTRSEVQGRSPPAS